MWNGGRAEITAWPTGPAPYRLYERDEGGAMRLRMVTFDLQAPTTSPTSPSIGHAKISKRRIPSTDLEGTQGGILDPTPIH